ncbi:hypothetical protein Tco_0945657 [Tanacetum coccineum]
MYGRNSLKKAIEKIYHTPETGVTDSKVFYGVQKSVPYKGDMPRSFANLDKGIVEELYKDRRWVILVLAVLWREKGAEEGKFSSSDPVKYEEGESSSSHAKSILNFDCVMPWAVALTAHRLFVTSVRVEFVALTLNQLDIYTGADEFLHELLKLIL